MIRSSGNKLDHEGGNDSIGIPYVTRLLESDSEPENEHSSQESEHEGSAKDNNYYVESPTIYAYSTLPKTAFKHITLTSRSDIEDLTVAVSKLDFPNPPPPLIPARSERRISKQNPLNKRKSNSSIKSKTNKGDASNSDATTPSLTEDKETHSQSMDNSRHDTPRGRKSLQIVSEDMVLMWDTIMPLRTFAHPVSSPDDGRSSTFIHYQGSQNKIAQLMGNGQSSTPNSPMKGVTSHRRMIHSQRDTVIVDDNAIAGKMGQGKASRQNRSTGMNLADAVATKLFRRKKVGNAKVSKREIVHVVGGVSDAVGEKQVSIPIQQTTRHQALSTTPAKVKLPLQAAGKTTKAKRKSLRSKSPIKDIAPFQNNLQEQTFLDLEQDDVNMANSPTLGPRNLAEAYQEAPSVEQLETFLDLVDGLPEQLYEDDLFDDEDIEAASQSEVVITDPRKYSELQARQRAIELKIQELQQKQAQLTEEREPKPPASPPLADGKIKILLLPQLASRSKSKSPSPKQRAASPPPPIKIHPHQSFSEDYVTILANDQVADDASTSTQTPKSKQSVLRSLTTPPGKMPPYSPGPYMHRPLPEHPPNANLPSSHASSSTQLSTSSPSFTTPLAHPPARQLRRKPKQNINLAAAQKQREMDAKFTPPHTPQLPISDESKQMSVARMSAVVDDMVDFFASDNQSQSQFPAVPESPEVPREDTDRSESLPLSPSPSSPPLTPTTTMSSSAPSHRPTTFGTSASPPPCVSPTPSQARVLQYAPGPIPLQLPMRHSKAALALREQQLEMGMPNVARGFTTVPATRKKVSRWRNPDARFSISRAIMPNPKLTMVIGDEEVLLV